MATLETFVVPASLDGDRVDRAVAFHTGWTRAEAQAIIDDGGVLIDDRVVAKSYRLHEGETVRITSVPVEVGYPTRESIAVDVEYADDDVIIVHKPAGLVVHPGAGNDRGTLVNGLLDLFSGE